MSILPLLSLQGEPPVSPRTSHGQAHYDGNQAARCIFCMDGPVLVVQEPLRGGDNEEAYSASLAEPRSVAINSILVAHRGFNNVLRTYEIRRIPSGIFQATMRVTLEQ